MKTPILSFITILLLATILRFYQLAQVPHGMTWDEAAIGYNGYAILTTRRDEWLARLPASFQSFGDYKAPLAIYLNGFFTLIFGMNLWAVRFPFAVSGVMAVLGMMLLTKEILEKYKIVKEEKVTVYSLIAGTFLAFSPWHLHFSRAGFESGMSLTFLIWGSYFLFRFFKDCDESICKKKSIKKVIRKTAYILFSSLFFVASMYAYHSAKIVAPFLAISIVFLNKEKIWMKLVARDKKTLRYFLILFTSVLFSLFLLKPMITDSLYGEGLARSGTLVFGQGLSLPELVKTISLNYKSHFSAGFLLLGKTTSLRHGDGKWGVLLPITFLIILRISIKYIASLFSKKIEINKKIKKIFIFSWVWIILGILPAALGTEIPHSNRALLAFPGFVLLAVVGISELYECLQRKSQNWENGQLKVKSILGTLILIHGITIVAYLGNYYTAFASDSANAFNDGYLEAYEYIIPYEKGLDGHKEVDKVLFTSEYGQAYIYALFARRTNPIWYQGGSLIKYEFTDKINIGDLSRENALIVAGQSSDLPVEKADRLIYGSDGKIRFMIYHTF